MAISEYQKEYLKKKRKEQYEWAKKRAKKAREEYLARPEVRERMEIAKIRARKKRREYAEAYKANKKF